MLRRMSQWLLARTTEIVLSIGLVLASFLVVLLFLSWSFPRGYTLTQLMQGGRTTLNATRDASWSYDLGGVQTAREPFIALLTHVKRRVKDKPAHAIAWADSNTGLPLFDRHSIQTFTRSGATITFHSDARMELDENTLIVLRAVAAGSAGRRRASLVVLDGELRATLGKSSDGPSQFDIVLPNGSALVDSSGGDASLRVTVNDDKSTTVSVLEGAAEVTAGDETIRVDRDKALTLGPDGRPGAVLDLPDTPVLEEPTDNRLFTFRAAPPRVRFAWRQDPTADTYLFEIARDREFTEIAYSERLQATEIVHGNLKPGTYYWRTTAIRGWARGLPSESRFLEMHQDAEAPRLRVEFPEGPVSDEQITLTGSAEPGSRLVIGDVEVAVMADGTFRHVLTLAPGINVVVVEAVDIAGNVTYESHMVTANY